MNVDGMTYIALRLRGFNPTAPPSTRPGLYDYRDDALCAQVDPVLFHPDKGDSNRAARRVCQACPVVAACLEANIGEQYGVFGGTSAKERQALRKARREAAA